MGICGPTHDRRSWTFDLDPGGLDPVLRIPRIQDAYFKRDPDYPRGITVPAIVDVADGRRRHQRLQADHRRPRDASGASSTATGAPDLYPDALADEIEAVSEPNYRYVNNGVYRCGFAGTQEAYDKAYRRLWDHLDLLEERLATRRYLVGDHITEADVRLFTTLVRFDPVYHGHFKCNRSKLIEMPALWGYARDLFQTPGFGDTVDFTHIKRHYYVVHTDVNPTGVVPARAGAGRTGRRRTDARSWAARPSVTGTPPGPPREVVPPEHNPVLAPACRLTLRAYAAGFPCAAREPDRRWSAVQAR